MSGTLEAQLLKQIYTTSINTLFSFLKTAVSPSGDVYVSGSFKGTLDIGGGVSPITGNSKYSGFIAKYTSNLTPTLLKYVGGTTTTDPSYVSSMAISSSGDVYVSGGFKGTLSIGGGIPPITSGDDETFFIAKYTSNLTPTLLKSLGGTYSTDNSFYKNYIAISSSGDVYVSGGFKGTINIGGGVPPITNTFINSFIAKYTSNLTPTLLKSVGDNNGISTVNSMAISSSGDVYVSGAFTGTLDIGGGVPSITTNSTNVSSFIAKYTSNLTPTLLKYIGGTATNDTSFVTSMAISPSGDVYVSGAFGGTLDIGGGLPPITNSNDIGGFIAKYTSNLTPTLLKYIGGTTTNDTSRMASMAISSSGDVHVSGAFGGTLDIGGGVPSITTNSTDVSGFIAKYTSNLTPTLLKSLGGTATTDISDVTSIAISSSGDVYVSGGFKGTINIGGGVPPITSTDFALFIAKYFITNNEPICLVSGTPILTDQAIVPIDKIDTSIHTISNQRIVAVTKAITPEHNLICFEKNSMAINCPTKRTIMTPGHEVLYKGKLVQAKHFVGKLDGVHTVPYDGKVVYNVLLEKRGLMSVNNMIVETLNPENKVAKSILNAL